MAKRGNSGAFSCAKENKQTLKIKYDKMYFINSKRLLD
jgi:hypothetical protein